LKFLILIIIIILNINLSLARDLSLEERVSKIEYTLNHISDYIEKYCELILDYVGTSSNLCFDSLASGIPIRSHFVETSIFNTSSLDCKIYRLRCM